MSVIRKYLLSKHNDRHTVSLPRGAKFLTCQRDGGMVGLYFEVETDKPDVSLEFILIRTHEEVPAGLITRYTGIATFNDFTPPLEVHVFQIITPIEALVQQALGFPR